MVHHEGWLEEGHTEGGEVEAQVTNSCFSARGHRVYYLGVCPGVPGLDTIDIGTFSQISILPAYSRQVRNIPAEYHQAGKRRVTKALF